MKCNATCISALNIASIDATTIEVRCAIHGAYYMFKNDDDAWESGDDRKKRMAEYRICENPECGAEYQIKDHALVYGNNQYARMINHICPACAKSREENKIRSGHRPPVRTGHDTTWSRYGISVR